MKRLLCLLLALTALFSLSGCEKAPVQTTPSTTASSPTETAAPETTAAPATEAGPAPLSRAAGSYKERYNSGTSEESWMEYYLHIPEGATENMPLIIFLHGDGEIGLIDNLENYGMIESAREIYGEAFPFISLSPCTRTDSWIRDDISGLLKELIDTIVHDYAIDESRIIITGHSRGAIGTWYYINMNYYYPSFESDISFSCALPISHYAAYPINGELSAQTPIWAICGDGDTIEKECVEELTRNIELVNASGGNAKMTVLTGNTHAETEANAYTKEVFEWMLAQ